MRPNPIRRNSREFSRAWANEIAHWPIEWDRRAVYRWSGLLFGMGWRRRPVSSAWAVSVLASVRFSKTTQALGGRLATAMRFQRDA
jgi:hypothetical protein